MHASVLTLESDEYETPNSITSNSTSSNDHNNRNDDNDDSTSYASVEEMQSMDKYVQFINDEAADSGSSKYASIPSENESYDKYTHDVLSVKDEESLKSCSSYSNIENDNVDISSVKDEESLKSSSSYTNIDNDEEDDGEWDIIGSDDDFMSF